MDTPVLDYENSNASIPKSRMCGPQVRFCESPGKATSPGYSTREVEGPAPMPFWVYILRCSDRSLYVGHTDRLEERPLDPRSGDFGGYVAQRLPAGLVFAQEFPSRDEALSRERQIKNWSRAKKEALIAGDWARLKRLAKGRG